MISRFQAALDGSIHTAIHFHRRHTVQAVSAGPGNGTAMTGVAEGGTVRCVAEGGAPATVGFATPEGVSRAVRRAAELARSLRREGGTPRMPLPAHSLDRARVEAGWLPGLDQVCAFLDEMVSTLRARDRRIVQARIRQSIHLTERWIVTSEGVTVHDSTPMHDLVAIAIAQESGTVERAIQSWGQGMPLDSATGERMAHATAEAAIALLDATPLAPGRYPVILAPAAAALLAHRALGHVLGGAPDLDPLPVGTRLGPETVTLGDDGTVPGLRGSMPVDDEGTPGQNTTLVRNGVVVGAIHSRESAASARESGAAATGNLRTGLPGSPPALRLTNTYLAAGQATLSDLLADVSLGIYGIEAVGCRGDHGLAGLRLTAGRMIRHGALAEPVKDIVISTSLRECLGRIEGVAADFQWDSSASWCHGGGSGLVPVTGGAPHLRFIDLAVNDLLGGGGRDDGRSTEP